MNIKKYQTLVRVIELGSLTRAAEALGYTQSGVSHMLNSLEEELGFAILMRSRSGVRLTPEGERVMPVIRHILNNYEQLSQTAADIRGIETGTVRVAAFTSVAVHWLPGMIKTFLARHPQVDFQLMNGDYHDVTQWLADGTVDLGFVALPAPLQGQAIPLRKDRLMAVLPLDHPMADRDCFPIEAMASEPFISLLKCSDHDARRVLAKAGVTPQVRFTTKDDYAIVAMVSQGLGLSIMPELLLQGLEEHVRILPLDPPASRTIALATGEGIQLNPAARHFMQMACHWVENHR